MSVSRGKTRKVSQDETTRIQGRAVLNKAKEIVLAREDGDIRLVDRKLWNYLLATIYGAQPVRQNLYQIQVGSLMSVMAHKSVERLHESLERLARARISIDYQDETGLLNTVRGSYLSYHMTHAEHEWVTFSFDAIVLGLIYDPKVFASLAITAIQKFRSSYSLRLYEILSLFVHRRHPVWEISLDEFFERLSVPESYRRMDNLKRRIIEPAIAEITAYTMLKVSVKYKTGQAGGKTHTLIFSVSQHKKKALQGSLLLPTEKGSGPGELDLAPPQLKDATIAEAVEILQGNRDRLMELFATWQQAFSGIVMQNADRAFLNWLMLNHTPLTMIEGGEEADEVMTDILGDWASDGA